MCIMENSYITVDSLPLLVNVIYKRNTILAIDRARLILRNNVFEKNKHSNGKHVYCASEIKRMILDDNLFDGRDQWCDDDVYLQLNVINFMFW